MEKSSLTKPIANNKKKRRFAPADQRTGQAKQLAQYGHYCGMVLASAMPIALAETGQVPAWALIFSVADTQSCIFCFYAPKMRLEFTPRPWHAAQTAAVLHVGGLVF